MHDVFAEESWALPAHVRNHPTGKDPRVIDLFAAETANLFAELLAVFAAILPADFAQQIRHRLRTQIFENYLTGEHYWQKRDSNWNAVCHQGVLGAALAIEDDPDLLARMLHRAADDRLIRFLSGYGNDGATVEGPGYWAYGFGWFAELNAQLETRTQNQLSLFHSDPKITAIARFGPATLLQNNFAINFSDGGPHARLRPPLLQYLADRLNDPFIAGYAQAGWQSQSWMDTLFTDQRSDFIYLSRLLLRAPSAVPATSLALPAQDLYWPDAQWLLSRISVGGHTIEFAAKAGHNAENHNHNDLGSWLLNIDGQRACIEIGSPEYTRDFFSDQRYHHIAARSLGHPVPLINHTEQSAGKEFTSAVLRQQFTPTEVEFTLDLTRAYPSAAHLTRLTRTFLLNKPTATLTITDAFDLTQSQSLETALITQLKPTLHADHALLELRGITLQITPDANTQIHEIQTHSYSQHDSTPTQIHRLVLIPRQLTPTCSLSYSLSLR